MNIPQKLKYSKDHEWVRIDGDIATVGITDYAQDQLGDIVFFELPAIGRKITSGEVVAVVESVKSASDIYSPVSGEIIEINQAIVTSPETANRDPYKEGWLFRVKTITVPTDLLSASQYQELIG